MYACLHIGICSLFVVTLYKSSKVFLVNTVLDSLLATVKNITNVNFIWYCILIGHTYPGLTCNEVKVLCYNT